MCFLMWLRGWSETLKQCTQGPVCTQEVLPNRAAEAPAVCPGGCLGEDGHPDEAGAHKIEPS